MNLGEYLLSLKIDGTEIRIFPQFQTFIMVMVFIGGILFMKFPWLIPLY